METKPSFHFSHPFIGKTELAALSLQPAFIGKTESWLLFHANPKLSTVSFQDKWLRLNELNIYDMMRRRGHLYYYCHDEGRNLTFIAKTAPPRIHHQTSRIKCAFWCLTLLVGLFSLSYLLAGFLDLSTPACLVTWLKLFVHYDS